jgi:signal transduction histidine kinase
MGNALEIEDRGPGIPRDVAERIGQPFNYGHKGTGGFGLGLAWVSTICHKYGWTLSFRAANAGIGSIARIDFPVE